MPKIIANEMAPATAGADTTRIKAPHRISSYAALVLLSYAISRLKIASSNLHLAANWGIDFRISEAHALGARKEHLSAGGEEYAFRNPIRHDPSVVVDNECLGVRREHLVHERPDAPTL